MEKTLHRLNGFEFETTPFGRPDLKSFEYIGTRWEVKSAEPFPALESRVVNKPSGLWMFNIYIVENDQGIRMFACVGLFRAGDDAYSFSVAGLAPNKEFVELQQLKGWLRLARQMHFDVELIENVERMARTKENALRPRK